MRRSFYGRLAKLIRGIPVERAQDIAHKGTGTVLFISEKEVKVTILKGQAYRGLEQHSKKISAQVIV